MLTPNFFPGMVVVGIPNTDRGRDLDVGEGEDTGSANFRLFVEKELLPYLAETYRASGYKILMGHSLAGLFTLHTALDQPQLFDAYIATSPSLAYAAGQATIRNDLEKLENDSLSGRYLYFCAGGEERGELLQQLEVLDEEFARRKPSGFSWSKDVFDQEGHFPTKGFYQGMRRVFADWAPPTQWFSSGTLEELQKHYQLLGARYAMPVKPPSDLIWSLRRRLERTGEVDKHLAATVYHVEQYPANTARYVVLAEIYLARSEKEKAISTLETGLALNPGAEDIRAKLVELKSTDK
jgi:pimeloyl-ACP methyl ester carboxylesterase